MSDIEQIDTTDSEFDKHFSCKTRNQKNPSHFFCFVFFLEGGIFYIFRNFVFSWNKADALTKTT